MRTASVKRETGETQIDVSVNIDGSGKVQVKSGFEFIDSSCYLNWQIQHD